VVQHTVNLTRAGIQVNWGAMEGRAWDTDTWLADYSKARRALKWAPKTSLSSGLEKTIQWFRSRGYWKPQPYASHAMRDL